MDQLAESRTIAGELPLSPNAVVVLKRRYLKKDDRGEVTEARPGYVPPGGPNHRRGGPRL